MIFLVMFQKCPVEGLTLVEEVHTLDAVADGLLRLWYKLPAKEFHVEGFGPRNITHWNLEPANLAE